LNHQATSSNILTTIPDDFFSVNSFRSSVNFSANGFPIHQNHTRRCVPVNISGSTKTGFSGRTGRCDPHTLSTKFSSTATNFPFPALFNFFFNSRAPSTSTDALDRGHTDGNYGGIHTDDFPVLRDIGDPFLPCRDFNQANLH